MKNLIKICLFLLAGLSGAVMPLRADNPPTYLFEIDRSVVLGAGFEPFYIALDSSNNTYVSDQSDYRIVKFSGNGAYLTQWGTPGSGNSQFSSPSGIATDSSNNIYVVDDNNSRIEKFDGNGNYLMQWGTSGTGNGQFYLPPESSGHGGCKQL
jgi:DNA-binding beta-propeller fold protein YncE